MYAAGGFQFPTSTGNYSVAVGFQPQMVLMFGGNRPELETHVTGAAGPGMFVSLNALDYSTSAIRSLCVAFQGKPPTPGYAIIQSPTGCIRMMPDGVSQAAVVEYRASSITFNSNGFTINVNVAAPGVRPIHWMAFGTGSNDPVPVRSAAWRGNTPAGPFASSFQGLSTLVLSTVLNNGAAFTQGGLDDENWFRFGSGHYPASSNTPDDWKSSTAFTEIINGTAVGRQGYTEQWTWLGSGISSHNTSHTVGPLGPAFIEAYRRHRPQSVGSTTFVNEGGGANNTYEEAVWWNGEGWTGTKQFPADGASVTENTPANVGDEFALVLFPHINGDNLNTGVDATIRFGMGVLHRDYQGCVSFGNDGSFYQSTTEAVARVTASDLHTAIGDFPTGKFRLTGNNGTGTLGQTVWVGFGGVLREFRPHIYRRVFR